jgi:hypothetical protein
MLRPSPTPIGTIQPRMLSGIIFTLGMAATGCRTLLPAPEIEATVVQPTPRLESAPTFTVRMLFRNTGPVDRTCRRYTLRWRDGQKDVDLDAAFVVPARGVVERSCGVGYLADPGVFERTATVTVYCERPQTRGGR